MAKTKEKLERPEDVGEIQIESRHIQSVLEKKLTECDRQNTLLLALVNQQQEEIVTLRASVDEAAQSLQNREQRRAATKKKGKKNG